jgi:hypothetical protein
VTCRSDLDIAAAELRPVEDRIGRNVATAWLTQHKMPPTLLPLQFELPKTRLIGRVFCVKNARWRSVLGNR